MQRTLVNDLLAQVHDRWMDDRSGEVLHGIPALENVDPDTFGICLATADGHVYEEGDTDLPFCIQSISKAFTYGMALEDNGTKQVDAKIDVEPSGDLFNEISLHPVTHRPRNPMINAGAIAAASLVRGAGVHDQVERVQTTFSEYADRRLEIDDEIYASMQESGHRNRAISHMLREFGILECSPDDALEVYLRACSTMVTCCDLAMMGATLANLGINPRTGKTVLPQVHMERVLSVMSTCGMYDAAGEWVASVGMAAKSGVGGGIVAVLPGQLALAVFSPRLDEHGNSVRGVQACRQLSQDLELHALHVTRAAHGAIRDSYDIVEAPSSMQRPQADRDVLEVYGRHARIYEVHGDLLFAGAESVVRAISRDRRRPRAAGAGRAPDRGRVRGGAAPAGLAAQEPARAQLRRRARGSRRHAARAGRRRQRDPGVPHAPGGHGVVRGQVAGALRRPARAGPRRSWSWSTTRCCRTCRRRWSTSWSCACRRGSSKTAT